MEYMELLCTSRREWHDWLDKNHSTSEEIWLIYYKKHSGIPRVSYKDAVEEALCFGWIDGKIKRINDDYFVQRFTPRRHGSKWSKHNMEIVRDLMSRKLMKPAGMMAFQKALDAPGLVYDNRDADIEIPDDLSGALKSGASAFDNFMNFPVSGRRMCIYWLNSAKRSDTRLRRIEKIVKIAEKNIRPGMI